jgi:hypothetical protein
MSDDPLYFAKNVQGAGTNRRSIFDPEDGGDGGENLDNTTVLPTRPRISSKKRFELIPGQEQLGTPPSTVVASSRNPRAGGRDLDRPYCAAAKNDQGHAKATHIFYGFNTGPEQAGWPLCPQHLVNAEENLKIKKAQNPNILVRPSEDITHASLYRNINIEKDMRDDLSGLASMLLISKGVHPDSPEAAVGAEKANAGRTPYYNSEDWNSGQQPPTAASTRSEEDKETALNSVLEKARNGDWVRSKHYTISNPNYDSNADPEATDVLGSPLTAERVPIITSKNDKEIRQIGENQDATRDFSKGGYVVDSVGGLSRVYPGNKEAQNRRKIKGPAVGNGYVASTKTGTEFGKVNAPIDNVINAARVHKSQGMPLTTDVWHDLTAKHGEGVVTPEHIRTAIKIINTPRKPHVDLDVIPFNHRAGAFARYKEELDTPQDISLEEEANDYEKWVNASRTFNFNDGLGH